MELVKITNVGTEPVEFYGNEKTTVLPGKTKIVPWEFACAWLGDPTPGSTDRELRYNQVRLQWGYADGLDTPETWAEKNPTIAVEDMDGNSIIMVINDPNGEAGFAGLGGSVLDTDATDANVLRAQLNEMAARQARTEALLASVLNGATQDLDPSTLNALSTADGGAPSTQLPKPVETPATATDAPKRISK